MADEHSPLSLEIELAIKAAPKVSPFGSGTGKLGVYRTDDGTVFAAERRGQRAVALWLPADARVKHAADAEGLSCEPSAPNYDASSGKVTGRNHHLEQIEELKYATLYRVKATSAANAMRVIAALNA